MYWPNLTAAVYQERYCKNIVYVRKLLRWIKDKDKASFIVSNRQTLKKYIQNTSWISTRKQRLITCNESFK